MNGPDILSKELEEKQKKYREWVEKKSYLIEQGIEWKECEGCYCQFSANKNGDFCFDCLDCEKMSCGDHDPNFGNCCACYGEKK